MNQAEQTLNFEIRCRRMRATAWQRGGSTSKDMRDDDDNDDGDGDGDDDDDDDDDVDENTRMYYPLTQYIRRQMRAVATWSEENSPSVPPPLLLLPPTTPPPLSPLPQSTLPFFFVSFSRSSSWSSQTPVSLPHSSFTCFYI
ncbi:hypothetical protein HZH66_003830 [Vespula vulgaris]|uniref:Uncharacterized protein n=1 Tax=Vespula vulgaris TaxID=7454 RepID=A0A834KHK9_VESVU|nr:hypothetical protein HZH66_003830 [Vespula vulgaris]